MTESFSVKRSAKASGTKVGLTRRAALIRLPELMLVRKHQEHSTRGVKDIIKETWVGKVKVLNETPALVQVAGFEPINFFVF